MLLYYTKCTRYDENLMKHKQYVTVVPVHLFYVVVCVCTHMFVCVCVCVFRRARLCVNVFVFLFSFFIHFMLNASRRKCNLNGSLRNHLQHYTQTDACAAARAHSFIGGCPALYFFYYVYRVVRSLNWNYCCCWFRFYTISFVLYFCMRGRTFFYRRLITFRLFEN